MLTGKKSAEVLAYKVGISMSSILQILKQDGFSSRKSTVKLGLANIARQKRFQFTLEY
jgi:hypothetical protein